MIAGSTPWLPKTALDNPELANAIRDCICLWSLDWFSSTRLSAASGRKKKAAEPAAGNTCTPLRLTHPDGISLVFPVDGKIAIASAMLGGAPKPIRLKLPDLEFLELLADAALDDLYQRMEGLFGIKRASWTSPKSTAENYLQGTMQDDLGKDFLSYEAQGPLLVRLAKTLAASPHPLPDCVSTETALAEQPITVSAQIGRVKLKLPEIEQLELGDVLNLGNPVDDALDILLADTAMIDSAAILSFTENRVDLTIERPVSQWKKIKKKPEQQAYSHQN